MARKLNTGIRGGSLHREGIYHLRCEDAEERTSPTSGNDYWNLRFSVLRNGRPFGVSVWDRLVLNENSEWRQQQLFDALQAPENIEVDCNWMKGREVYARVVQDTTRDDPSNAVKSYLLPDVAERLLAKEAEGSESLNGMGGSVEDSSAKARGRGRPRQNQPAELSEEEAMPL